VDPVVVGVEQRVRVGADAVERDEAEVEQSAPADDDVQPEGEQHVEDGVEADAPHVAAARDHGQEAGGAEEEDEPGPPRNEPQARLDDPEPRREAPLDVARDPLVVADRRRGDWNVGAGRIFGRRVAHGLLRPS
jgi:hypothetical protein